MMPSILQLQILKAVQLVSLHSPIHTGVLVLLLEQQLYKVTLETQLMVTVYDQQTVNMNSILLIQCLRLLPQLNNVPKHVIIFNCTEKLS
jgi:hypothetical protein